ncbi:hypothetical protein E2320_005689 [Naja naja]|nr:hypothetical protein E2320_005689 [Naja naja]
MPLGSRAPEPPGRGRLGGPRRSVLGRSTSQDRGLRPSAAAPQPQTDSAHEEPRRGRLLLLPPPPPPPLPPFCSQKEKKILLTSLKKLLFTPDAKGNGSFPSQLRNRPFGARPGGAPPRAPSSRPLLAEVELESPHGAEGLLPHHPRPLRLGASSSLRTPSLDPLCFLLPSSQPARWSQPRAAFTPTSLRGPSKDCWVASRPPQPSDSEGLVWQRLVLRRAVLMQGRRVKPGAALAPFNPRRRVERGGQVALDPGRETLPSPGDPCPALLAPGPASGRWALPRLPPSPEVGGLPGPLPGEDLPLWRTVPRIPRRLLPTSSYPAAETQGASTGHGGRGLSCGAHLWLAIHRARLWLCHSVGLALGGISL